MKLYLNSTSPYARIARIAALEKGLAKALELVWCDPWADGQDFLAQNPVGRVPVLVTREGNSIAESALIALYLDAQSGSGCLFPAQKREANLHIAGLGMGLVDAAFGTVIMRKHHGKAADDSLLGDRRLRAIRRTLAVLDTDVSRVAEDPVAFGVIVVAVALDYLAFRLPEIDWHEHAGLSALYQRMQKRDSFSGTGFTQS